MKWCWIPTVLLLLLVVGLVWIGCAGPGAGGYADASLRALRSIKDADQATLEEGSAAEKEALERFRGFFADFAPEPVGEKVRDVYAERFFFNDTVKTVEDIDKLRDYLVHSAAAVASCAVEIHDVVVRDGDYYLRWTMDIRFRNGKHARSIGLTHLRFDESGKVIYHQDYWDSATGLFEHLPFVGGILRRIKARL